MITGGIGHDATKDAIGSFLQERSRGRQVRRRAGGFGLSLLVKPSSTGRTAKSWSQRIRLAGSATNLGLGSFPAVTLSNARGKALANARAVAEGRDPRGSGIPTFAEAAEKTIELQRGSWKGDKTERLWNSRLAKYALPKFGGLRVDQVTVADVLAVIGPIWQSHAETATKLRQILSVIFRWSIAHSYRTDDPAHAVAAILPKQTGSRNHYAATPYAKVRDAIAKVRDAEACQTAKLALEFVILTAVRSGEARGARWDEIDLEAALWTIPADRMKAGRAFRIPLSGAALELLKAADSYRDASGLIFPSANGRVMRDGALSGLLRDAGVAGTVHGFRSSFRDWCSEKGQPRELAELSLAHSIGNAVEQSYARSDLLNKRRELMEQWATHIHG